VKSAIAAIVLFASASAFATVIDSKGHVRPEPHSSTKIEQVAAAPAAPEAKSADVNTAVKACCIDSKGHPRTECATGINCPMYHELCK
jgi:hypothetical protein